ncbi:MAG: hypothetical protein RLZ61_2158, partial [Planctomycetota bacterium]
NSIFIILGLTFYIALGAKKRFPCHFDFEMNVGCSAWVCYRFDSAEIILARSSGGKSPEALKVRILLCFVAGFGMQVCAIVIALPDFHHSVFDRGAIGVKNLACNMSDLTYRGSDFVIDDNKIVVRIEGQFIRVEGAIGLLWSQSKLLRKQAWYGVIRSSEDG